jgi:hypothetical protein
MFPLLGCARVDNICFDQKLILTYKKAETLRTFGLFSGPRAAAIPAAPEGCLWTDAAG